MGVVKMVDDYVNNKKKRGKSSLNTVHSIGVEYAKERCEHMSWSKCIGHCSDVGFLEAVCRIILFVFHFKQRSFFTVLVTC